ncbi:sensor histidine kinase, partial [Clostridioides difficile]|nr:sensor histidine kinase [Clostridioides difficile]
MLGGKKSNNKKVEKLRTIFIKYLSLFFIMTISIVLILILLFSWLLSSG